MRLIRKLSFVLIAILALLISPGFSRAQQGYIGKDEIVINGVTYKRAITEFQKISPSNESTPPSVDTEYLQQDPYPSLEGQTVSPTVICEDASESKCISIGGLKTVATGDPVYGDLYEQSSLWQKVYYDGKVYYAPYDRLSFGSVTQPVIPIQNPSSGYTRTTIDVYNPDCQKINCNYDDQDYAYDQWVANNQQYGQSFAELTGGGLVNSALYFHKWSVDFIPGLAKGFLDIIGGFNNSVADSVHSRLGEKIYPSLSEITSDPQQVLDSEKNDLLENPLYYKAKTDERIGYGGYLIAEGVGKGVVGMGEGIWTAYADPGGVLNGLAKLGQIAITDKNFGIPVIVYGPIIAMPLMTWNLVTQVGPVIADGIGKMWDESTHDTEKALVNTGETGFTVGSLVVPEEKVVYVGEIGETGKGLELLTDAGEVDNSIGYTDEVVQATVSYPGATDDLVYVAESPGSIAEYSKGEYIIQPEDVDNIAGYSDSGFDFKPSSGGIYMTYQNGNPQYIKVIPGKIGQQYYWNLELHLTPDTKDVLENSKDIKDLFQTNSSNNTYTNNSISSN